MYQVIARKYRPKSFGELISQEHVKTTIENAISQRRIAHGYIFSGQRGTGKTTVARILARCLNCEQGPTPTPCGVCASCLEITGGNTMDVIEIDAASNRGINEMRELRENVRFRPARDRYKVFIVDEAHQITSEAFNALLKTLEEPPEWVVFILCTTEVHKIPTTIASRCQQFSFRSVDFQELVDRMRWICGEEGITADDEALSVLAQAGEGSVRDSLSALDQAIACCGEKLTGPEVRELLGMFSLASLEKVAEALATSDTNEAARQMLAIVGELEANGRSLQHFCRELARYIRNLLVARIVKPDKSGTRLISASAQEQASMAEIATRFSEEDLTRYLQLTLEMFKDLQFALQPRLHLEIGLLRLVHAGKLVDIEQALASLGSGSAPAGKAPAPMTPPPATRPVTPRAAPVTPASVSPVEQPRVSAAPAIEAAKPMAAGDLRSRLHAALLELGQQFTADAMEHSDVTESASELVFTTPKMYAPSMKPAYLDGAVKQVLGKPMKLTVKTGEPVGANAPIASAGPVKSGAEEEATERAMAHPEVQRFQEMFPESQVRTVRNLRE
ncbi:MAG: DNA polymerase III subunit gamma/tau [Bryobacteraceae bacterium]